MNAMLSNKCNMGSVRHRRPGFTLIEAFVIVAIIAVLTVVLMPVFMSGRGHHGVCGSNLKQIGLGILQYSQDSDDTYPRTLIYGQLDDGTPRRLLSWRQSIFPYVKSQAVFRCTLGETDRGGVCAVDGFPQSYDVTDTGPVRVNGSIPQRAVTSPSATILVFEENGNTPQGQKVGVLWDQDSGEAGWTNILYSGHLGTSNYLFADGHVKGMRPLQTSADGTNRWHLNTHDPVSPRAMQKLQVAEDKYGDKQYE